MIIINLNDPNVSDLAFSMTRFCYEFGVGMDIAF